MKTLLQTHQDICARKCILTFVAVCFFVTSSGAYSVAQANTLVLPPVNQLLAVSPCFDMPFLRGLIVDRNDPFAFKFILDEGSSAYQNAQLREHSESLIKYFLAALTIPEKDLWVNLSPYEESQIIPTAFGRTDMGNDVLAQDYVLKQLVASLTYPESPLGKKFWERVQKRAMELYDTTNIPVNTFNKIWIAPDSVTLYEDTDRVIVSSAKLKVLLEDDYLALKNKTIITADKRGLKPAKDLTPQQEQEFNAFSGHIMKEIVLPAIEEEINTGKNFATLRQIYHSLILANWFKLKLKEHVLNNVYVNQRKIAGVMASDATQKDAIYQQYLQAYQKGIYDYIKREYEPASKKMVRRRYYSGGVNLADITKAMNAGTHSVAIMRAQAPALAPRLEKNNYAVSIVVKAGVVPMQQAPKNVFRAGGAKSTGKTVSFFNTAFNAARTVFGGLGLFPKSAQPRGFSNTAPQIGRHISNGQTFKARAPSAYTQRTVVPAVPVYGRFDRPSFPARRIIDTVLFSQPTLNRSVQSADSTRVPLQPSGSGMGFAAGSPVKWVEQLPPQAQTFFAKVNAIDPIRIAAQDKSFVQNIHTFFLPQAQTISTQQQPPRIVTKTHTYTFQKRINSGADAVIYRFTDEQGNAHALKVLKNVPDAPLFAPVTAVQEFAAMRAAAEYSKGTTVPVVESGRFINAAGENEYFLVMPYYPHNTLAEAIAQTRDSRSAVVLAAATGQRILQALSGTQQAGMLHSDVKPANVLIPQQGIAGMVLGDFGARQILQGDTALSRGTSGTLFYTPRSILDSYLNGDSTIAHGKNIDVYALGCVLYETLAGEKPFAAAYAQELKKFDERYDNVYLDFLQKFEVATRAPIPAEAQKYIKEMICMERAKRELPRDIDEVFYEKYNTPLPPALAGFVMSVLNERLGVQSSLTPQAALQSYRGTVLPQVRAWAATAQALPARQVASPIEMRLESNSRDTITEHIKQYQDAVQSALAATRPGKIVAPRDIITQWQPVRQAAERINAQISAWGKSGNTQERILFNTFAGIVPESPFNIPAGNAAVITATQALQIFPQDTQALKRVQKEALVFGRQLALAGAVMRAKKPLLIEERFVSNTEVASVVRIPRQVSKNIVPQKTSIGTSQNLLEPTQQAIPVATRFADMPGPDRKILRKTLFEYARFQLLQRTIPREELRAGMRRIKQAIQSGEPLMLPIGRRVHAREAAGMQIPIVTMPSATGQPRVFHSGGTVYIARPQARAAKNQTDPNIALAFAKAVAYRRMDRNYPGVSPSVKETIFKQDVVPVLPLNNEEASRMLRPVFASSGVAERDNADDTTKRFWRGPAELVPGARKPDTLPRVSGITPGAGLSVSDAAGNQGSLSIFSTASLSGNMQPLFTQVSIATDIGSNEFTQASLRVRQTIQRELFTIAGKQIVQKAQESAWSKEKTRKELRNLKQSFIAGKPITVEVDNKRVFTGHKGIVDLSGFSKSTAYRLLEDFVREGYTDGAGIIQKMPVPSAYNSAIYDIFVQAQKASVIPVVVIDQPSLDPYGVQQSHVEFSGQVFITKGAFERSSARGYIDYTLDAAVYYNQLGQKIKKISFLGAKQELIDKLRAQASQELARMHSVVYGLHDMFEYRANTAEKNISQWQTPVEQQPGTASQLDITGLVYQGRPLQPGDIIVSPNGDAQSKQYVVAEVRGHQARVFTHTGNGIQESLMPVPAIAQSTAHIYQGASGQSQAVVQKNQQIIQKQWQDFGYQFMDAPLLPASAGFPARPNPAHAGAVVAPVSAYVDTQGAIRFLGKIQSLSSRRQEKLNLLLAQGKIFEISLRAHAHNPNAQEFTFSGFELLNISESTPPVAVQRFFMSIPMVQKGPAITGASVAPASTRVSTAASPIVPVDKINTIIKDAVQWFQSDAGIQRLQAIARESGLQPAQAQNIQEAFLQGSGVYLADTASVNDIDVALVFDKQRSRFLLSSAKNSARETFRAAVGTEFKTRIQDQLAHAQLIPESVPVQVHSFMDVNDFRYRTVQHFERWFNYLGISHFSVRSTPRFYDIFGQENNNKEAKRLLEMMFLFGDQQKYLSFRDEFLTLSAEGYQAFKERLVRSPAMADAGRMFTQYSNELAGRYRMIAQESFDTMGVSGFEQRFTRVPAAPFAAAASPIIKITPEDIAGIPEIQKAHATGHLGNMPVVDTTFKIVKIGDLMRVWSDFGKPGDPVARARLTNDINFWEQTKGESFNKSRKLAGYIDAAIQQARKAESGQVMNCLWYMHRMHQDKKISDEQYNQLLAAYNTTNFTIKPGSIEPQKIFKSLRIDIPKVVGILEAEGYIKPHSTAEGTFFAQQAFRDAQPKQIQAVLGEAAYDTAGVNAAPAIYSALKKQDEVHLTQERRAAQRILYIMDIKSNQLLEPLEERLRQHDISKKERESIEKIKYQQETIQTFAPNALQRYVDALAIGGPTLSNMAIRETAELVAPLEQYQKALAAAAADSDPQKLKLKELEEGPMRSLADMYQKQVEIIAYLRQDKAISNPETTPAQTKKLLIVHERKRFNEIVGDVEKHMGQKPRAWPVIARAVRQAISAQYVRIPFAAADIMRALQGMPAYFLTDTTNFHLEDIALLGKLERIPVEERPEVLRFLNQVVVASSAKNAQRGQKGILVFEGNMMPEDIIAAVQTNTVTGIIANIGTGAHAAIIARAYGIPFYSATIGQLRKITPGKKVALIPQGNTVLLDTPLPIESKITRIQDQQIALHQGLQKWHEQLAKKSTDAPVFTADNGSTLSQMLEINDPTDLNNMDAVRLVKEAWVRSEMTSLTLQDIVQKVSHLRPNNINIKIVYRLWDQQPDKVADAVFEDASRGFQWYRTSAGRQKIISQIKEIIQYKIKVDGFDVDILVPQISHSEDIGYIHGVVEEAKKQVLEERRRFTQDNLRTPLSPAQTAEYGHTIDAAFDKIGMRIMFENASAIQQSRNLIQTAKHVFSKNQIGVHIGMKDLSASMSNVLPGDVTAEPTLRDNVPVVYDAVRKVCCDAAAENVPIALCGTRVNSSTRFFSTGILQDIPNLRISPSVAMIDLKETTQELSWYHTQRKRIAKDIQIMFKDGLPRADDFFKESEFYFDQAKEELLALAGSPVKLEHDLRVVPAMSYGDLRAKNKLALEKLQNALEKSDIESAVKYYYIHQVLAPVYEYNERFDLASEKHMRNFVSIVSKLPQAQQFILQSGKQWGADTASYFNPVLRELYGIYASVYANRGPYYSEREAPQVAALAIQHAVQLNPMKDVASRASDQQFLSAYRKEMNTVHPVVIVRADDGNFALWENLKGSLSKKDHEVIEIATKENLDKTGTLQYRVRAAMYYTQRPAHIERPISVEGGFYKADWPQSPSIWTHEVRQALQQAMVFLRNKNIPALLISEGGAYKGTMKQGTDLDTYLYVMSELHTGKAFDFANKTIKKVLQKKGIVLQEGLRKADIAVNGVASFTIRKNERGLLVTSADGQKFIPKTEKAMTELVNISVIDGSVISRKPTMAGSPVVPTVPTTNISNNVNAIAQEYNVAFVHGIHANWFSGDNSPLDESVTWQDKLAVTLALAPELSVSTIGKNDTARNMISRMGVILAGGKVTAALHKDARTIATGINSRSGGLMEDKPLTAQIHEAIGNRLLDTYNEFLVSQPRVAGFYVCMDAVSTHADNKTFERVDDSMADMSRIVAATEELGLPLYVVENGLIYNAVVKKGFVDQFGIAYPQRITIKHGPTPVEPAALSAHEWLTPEKKKTLTEKILTSGIFKIRTPEVMYTDAQVSGRQLYTELTAVQNPAHVTGETIAYKPARYAAGLVIPEGTPVRMLAQIPARNENIQYFVKDGQAYMRLANKKTGETVVREIMPNELFSADNTGIRISNTGDFYSLGSTVNSVDTYLQGMKEALAREDVAARTETGQNRLTELGFNLYGFAQQAQNMGDIQTAKQAFALARQAVPQESFNELMRRRVDKDGNFILTVQDISSALINPEKIPVIKPQRIASPVSIPAPRKTAPFIEQAFNRQLRAIQKETAGRRLTVVNAQNRNVKLGFVDTARLTPSQKKFIAKRLSRWLGAGGVTHEGTIGSFIWRLETNASKKQVNEYTLPRIALSATGEVEGVISYKTEGKKHILEFIELAPWNVAKADAPDRQHKGIGTQLALQMFRDFGFTRSTTIQEAMSFEVQAPEKDTLQLFSRMLFSRPGAIVFRFNKQTQRHVLRPVYADEVGDFMATQGLRPLEQSRVRVEKPNADSQTTNTVAMIRSKIDIERAVFQNDAIIYRRFDEYQDLLQQARVPFNIMQSIIERATKNPKKTIRVVDVGGGIGLGLSLMIQLLRAQGIDNVEGVLVDHDDWNEETIYRQNPQSFKNIKNLCYAMALPFEDKEQKLLDVLDKNVITFIKADMEKANIGTPADIVLNFHALQYHQDPLAVFANMYNQAEIGADVVAEIAVPLDRQDAAQCYKDIARTMGAGYYQYQNKENGVEHIVLYARRGRQQLMPAQGIQKVSGIIKVQDPLKTPVQVVTYIRPESTKSRMLDTVNQLARVVSANQAGKAGQVLKKLPTTGSDSEQWKKVFAPIQEAFRYNETIVEPLMARRKDLVTAVTNLAKSGQKTFTQNNVTVPLITPEITARLTIPEGFIGAPEIQSLKAVVAQVLSAIQMNQNLRDPESNRLHGQVYVLQAAIVRYTASLIKFNEQKEKYTQALEKVRATIFTIPEELVTMMPAQSAASPVNNVLQRERVPLQENLKKGGIDLGMPIHMDIKGASPVQFKNAAGKVIDARTIRGLTFTILRLEKITDVAALLP